MESGVRILLLEDTESDALLIQQEVELVLNDFQLKVVKTKKDFEKAVLSFKPDLIISDYRLPDYDGLSALKYVLKQTLFIPVIIVTGSINEDTAVNCMKEGAIDYVIKDNIKRLGPSILSALEHRNIRMENEVSKKKLVESEEKYRLLIENLNELVVKLDADGNFIFVSQSYCKTFGKNEEELIGSSFIPLVHPDDTEKTKEEMKKLSTPPYTCYVEQRAMTADGWRWFGWSDRALLNEKNEITSIIGVGRDITEQKETDEALRNSELQLRMIAETAPVGIVLSDENEKTVYVNKKFIEMFGYTIEDMPSVDKWWLDAYPDENYRENLKKNWAEAIIAARKEKSELKPIEASVTCKDGTVKEIEFRLSSTTTLNVIILSDITERKQFEKSLKDSEERFRSIYNNSTIGLYRTTPEGRIIMVNPAVVKMLGFNSVEELLQRNLDKNGFKENYPRHLFKAILEREGEVIGLESEWERKDGSTIFVRESAKAIKDENGKIIYYEGTVEDITERKIAESELEKYRIHLEELVEERTKQLTISEERFRQLAELSEDSITRYDKNFICIYANPAIKKQTGISPEDIVGKHILQLPIHKDYQQESFSNIKTVFEKGEKIRVEFLSDAGLWIDAVIIPEFDKSGNVQTILSFGRDVTERKRIEESIHKMLQKEKEINEIKTNFISMASHEFRTPLAAILSSSDLIKMYLKENINPNIAAHLSQIENSVTSMTLLLDEVLNLNRTERGIIEFNPKEINLFRLCSVVIENAKSLSKNTQTIEFDFKLKNKFVEADHTLLEHVLHNVMSNAVKYSPENGKILFIVEEINNNLEIKITDNGIGILKEEIKNIFEPFFRGSNVRYIQGTGMGLSVVKKYIEIHRGNITVESEPGSGTTVTLICPLKY